MDVNWNLKPFLLRRREFEECLREEIGEVRVVATGGFSQEARALTLEHRDGPGDGAYGTHFTPFYITFTAVFIDST